MGLRLLFFSLFQVFCSDCTVANSTISRLTTGYLHTKGPQPSQAALHEADAFLYNLRHPIDRVVAWHHFEHPYSCVDDNVTFNACRTMEIVDEFPGGLVGQFYIDCFPTPDLLPLAFANNDTLMTPECIKLAHKVFNDETPHVYGFTQTPFKFDLRYFTKVTIDVYPHTKSVLVLRSESLWDDLNDLERQLGGGRTFDSVEDQNMETDMRINGTDYGPVCCKMIDEMRAYRRLLLLSVNLDGPSKEETLATAVEKCQFSSWREMEESCQQQREKYLQSFSFYNRIVSAFTN